MVMRYTSDTDTYVLPDRAVVAVLSESSTGSIDLIVCKFLSVSSSVLASFSFVTVQSERTAVMAHRVQTLKQIEDGVPVCLA